MKSLCKNTKANFTVMNVLWKVGLPNAEGFHMPQILSSTS